MTPLAKLKRSASRRTTISSTSLRSEGLPLALAQVAHQQDPTGVPGQTTKLLEAVHRRRIQTGYQTEIQYYDAQCPYRTSDLPDPPVDAVRAAEKDVALQSEHPDRVPVSAQSLLFCSRALHMAGVFPPAQLLFDHRNTGVFQREHEAGNHQHVSRSHGPPWECSPRRSGAASSEFLGRHVHNPRLWRLQARVLARQVSGGHRGHGRLCDARPVGRYHRTSGHWALRKAPPWRGLAASVPAAPTSRPGRHRLQPGGCPPGAGSPPSW
jgi:hypothetical protein